jgi:hypothetical protein
MAGTSSPAMASETKPSRLLALPEEVLCLILDHVVDGQERVIKIDKAHGENWHQDVSTEYKFDISSLLICRRLRACALTALEPLTLKLTPAPAMLDLGVFPRDVLDRIRWLELGFCNGPQCHVPRGGYLTGSLLDMLPNLKSIGIDCWTTEPCCWVDGTPNTEEVKKAVEKDLRILKEYIWDEMYVELDELDKLKQDLVVQIIAGFSPPDGDEGYQGCDDCYDVSVCIRPMYIL